MQTDLLEVESNSVIEIIDKGGIMMYPIIALSVITLLLVIYYLITINAGIIYSKKFLVSIQKNISQGKFEESVVIAQENNSAIAKVIAKTCAFVSNTPNAQVDEIMHIADAEASTQAAKLSGKISYLADIGSIAPMLGLLGTVMGMIDSFLKIGSVDGVKPMQLASGVSEALITTASGLVVGIVALSIYTIYRGKVSELISTLDSTTSYLTSQISAAVRTGNRDQ